MKRWFCSVVWALYLFSSGLWAQSFPMLNGLREVTEPTDYERFQNIDYARLKHYDSEGKLLDWHTVDEYYNMGGQPRLFVNKVDKASLIILDRPGPNQQKEYEVFIKEEIRNLERVGKKAPELKALTLKGTAVDLEAYQGKVVVLNFWFRHCMPCVKEIPKLNGLVKKYQGKEVVFLAIALDDTSKLTGFLQQHRFDYEVIPNGEAMAEQYGVFSYPAHVVIDRSGIVRYYTSGYGEDVIAELEAAIKKGIGT